VTSDSSTTGPDLGVLYRNSRERISILVGPAADALDVPATPGWTVHDVVAHLRGLVEDVLAGNIEGAGTDPWTAEQVVRGREKPLEQLLEEWNEQAPEFEAFLSSPAGAAAARTVFDVHTHECDLRGALGAPAAAPDDFMALAFPATAQNFLAAVEGAGLPMVRVVPPQGDPVGPADAPVTLHVGRNEFLRAYLGRRSPDQVRSWDWSSDPAPYLAHLAVFGPRDSPLHD
jgi:uncharacterized protein (TIGR03083 family)